MPNTARCSGRSKIRHPQAAPTSSRTPPTHVQPLANRSRSFSVKIQPGVACSGGTAGGTTIEVNGASASRSVPEALVRAAPVIARWIDCTSGSRVESVCPDFSGERCIPVIEFHQSSATLTWVVRKNSQRGLSRSQVKFTAATAAGTRAIESRQPAARQIRRPLAEGQRHMAQPAKGTSTSQPSVRVWTTSVITRPATANRQIRISATACHRQLRARTKRNQNVASRRISGEMAISFPCKA